MNRSSFSPDEHVDGLVDQLSVETQAEEASILKNNAWLLSKVPPSSASQSACIGDRRPQNGQHHLSEHFAASNSVTWPDRITRAAGKQRSQGLCPGRRGNRFC